MKNFAHVMLYNSSLIFFELFQTNENTHSMLINLEKLITPVSSSSNIKITPEVLPKQYRNAIISSSTTETVIRSSISSTSDIDDWVKTFGINTGTRWNVRKSKPEVSCIRILCGLVRFYYYFYQ